MEFCYKKTARGFELITFSDRHDEACSLQKSSLAFEDAIWLGVDNANPRILHGDAKKLGIQTSATSGWVDYPLPPEVDMTTRMHLTRDQVADLLPVLQKFAETGEIHAAHLQREIQHEHARAHSAQED